jgi:UDP-glucose 4-epimerase
LESRKEAFLKKYLITGGSGFIGSHLVDLLMKDGNQVVVLDNLSTGKISNLNLDSSRNGLKFTQGSILDVSLVNKLVSEVDEVFHLAAAVGVDLIIKEPLESLETNIKGSEIVLEACSKYMKKVLVTSTSEIYGKNTSEELAEDDDRILGSPLKSRWSYSEAKAIEEILAHTYYKIKNLPTVIVRLFNTVGPRQVGRYGMVVPRFVEQSMKNVDITVFGQGNQRRCFCHVSDVVVAIRDLMNSPSAVGEVFNIGSQSEISITNLAKTIKEFHNSKSNIKYIPYETAYSSGFEDMERRRPNISKIHNHIGWKPQYELKTIIADMTDYFENQKLG